jgi:multiple sugar transport system substrate-binding protein
MNKKILLSVIVLLIFSVSIYSSTVKIWAMGEEAKQLGKIASVFEEQNPDITIDIQAIPWDNAYDKLLTGIAARRLPDIAQMGTTWMAGFGAMGVFEELTPYIEKSDIITEDHFFDASWQTVSLQDGIYGIPWYVDVRVMFYRTDLFKEAGYDKAPDNWEELYEISKKLAEREGNYGISLMTNEVQQFFPFVWQNGGRILDDEGNIVVDSPEFIEAIEYYARFFKEDISPKGGGGNIIQEFASGYTPIYFSGPWMVSLTRQQTPQIDGKWDVALMPKKESRTSFIGGSNWVLFNTSKNKEDAWKFIEFMSSHDTQLEWYNILASLPAVKSVWEEPALAEKPMISLFGEQLEDAQAPLTIPEYEEIASAISRRLEEACYGVKTPEEAALAMKRDIEKILR